MATVKKHWRAILLQGGLLVLCTGVIIGVFAYGDDGSAAAQPADAPEVDPWVYDRTQALRQTLGLTNADLAAMGMGAEQAGLVLRDLRGWVETNRAQIEAKRRGVLRARGALREAQRKVRVGPRDESVIGRLPGLQADLSAAVQTQATLNASAGAAVEGRLSAQQQALWQTIRSNADAPSRYRYAPDLDAARKRAIRQALLSRENNPARPRHARADQQLTAAQRQAAAAAEQTRDLHLAGVRRAEAEALPKPAELRQERLTEESQAE